MRMALLVCCTLALAARGANAQASQSAAGETIALLPWTFIHGADGAVQAVNDRLKEFLVTARLRPIREVPSRQSWYRRIECETTEADRKLVSSAHLMRLGEALGADWVATGRMVWRTSEMLPRNASFDWDGWNDTTAGVSSVNVRSECSIDLLLVDVKRHRTAVEVRGLKVTDHDLESPGTDRIRADIPILAEDLRSRIQTRMGLLALAKAIQPWIDSRR